MSLEMIRFRLILPDIPKINSPRYSYAYSSVRYSPINRAVSTRASVWVRS